MKKSLIYLAFAGMSVFAVSCGNEANEEAKEGSETGETTQQVVEEEVLPTFEETCQSATDVFLQVEGYEYGLSEAFTYNGKFDVKRSQYVVLNDSTAELKMYNYDLGEDTGNNLEIYVKLNAKNGNVLNAENYAYQDWESNYWSKVNIISPKGTVWFNWVSGMPEQGTVKIDFVDADHVCGNFMLEVNKPENNTIGHVVLNGSFSY